MRRLCAELIALAGRAQAFAPKRADKSEDTFLFKSSRKSPSNARPIIGTKVSVKWADGNTSDSVVNVALSHDGTEEKLRYLPQKFVEFLCAPENTQHIEEEIERVIFQRLDKTQRMGVSDFRELRQAAARSIVLRKRNVADAISSANRTIAELNTAIAQQESKRKQLELKKAELERMDKNKPVVPPENQEEIDKLNSLEELKRQKEQTIVQKTQQLSSLSVTVPAIPPPRIPLCRIPLLAARML